MLDGATVVVTGDPELSEPAETILCVQRAVEVAAGIDSRGVFCGIVVEASVGPMLAGANEASRWTIYSNGTVADDDDRTIGRHTLSSLGVEGAH